ncbi:tannase/feruloyl esterase family alpha/beta hydrolase [Bradyrhizobium sp. RDM4]|uniref:tannase/feruloyl esterase family alpha/beta hydrolase n=1 Tax=Bradyrhizobium sp. RDM4 TaxID=3378765 RepID=UPI0038FCB5CE
MQSFYRLFHAPGVGHCGAPIFSLGTTGPWPQNGADFAALVNWVEKGVAPDQVVGKSLSPALSRPLCPYPQTAKYKGTGDVNDAANWSCGGNLETREAVCPDVLVKYKDEVDGPLDFEASAVHQASARAGTSHTTMTGTEHDTDLQIVRLEMIRRASPLPVLCEER